MTHDLPEVPRPLRGESRRQHPLVPAHKLTQERLAEALGFSIRYVAGVERGEENLTLDSVDQLGRLLDVDALELLTVGPWDAPKS